MQRKFKLFQKLKNVGVHITMLYGHVLRKFQMTECYCKLYVGIVLAETLKYLIEIQFSRDIFLISAEKL